MKVTPQRKAFTYIEVSISGTFSNLNVNVFWLQRVGEGDLNQCFPLWENQVIELSYKALGILMLMLALIQNYKQMDKK